MFNRKKKEQKLRERIAMIKPTSKEALKRECLYMCNLNIEKAEKMYEFIIKDISGLPDLEPTSMPFLKSFGEQANGVFDWINKNKETIGQGVDFIKGIISRKGGPTPPATPLPPING